MQQWGDREARCFSGTAPSTLCQQAAQCLLTALWKTPHWNKRGKIGLLLPQSLLLLFSSPFPPFFTIQEMSLFLVGPEWLLSSSAFWGKHTGSKQKYFLEKCPWFTIPVTSKFLFLETLQQVYNRVRQKEMLRRHAHIPIQPPLGQQPLHQQTDPEVRTAQNSGLLKIPPGKAKPAQLI